MNEYQLNPNVCPSSLNEDGLPMTEGETNHVWDDTNDVIACSECGAVMEMTKEEALKNLDYVFDYYFDGADHETQMEMIATERYIKNNLQ